MNISIDSKKIVQIPTIPMSEILKGIPCDPQHGDITFGWNKGGHILITVDDFKENVTFDAPAGQDLSEKEFGIIESRLNSLPKGTYIDLEN